MLAQLGEHVTALLVAFIGGGALVVASWVSSRHGARRGAGEGVQALRDELDPRNGRSSGETTHDTAQTVEIIQAQAHTNAQELVSLHERLGGIDTKLDRVDSKIDRIDGRVDRVDSKIDRHLGNVGDNVGQITEWARRKMQEEE